MNRTSELEAALNAARKRLETEQGRFLTADGRLEEALAALNALREAERALAEAKEEEFAVPLEFPAEWDPGDARPLLLAGDQRTVLVFRRRVGGRPQSLEKSVDAEAVTEKSSYAVVEFTRCHSVKMGLLNESVLAGHPLFGKGMAPLTAMLIRNSRWISELQAIESVHPGFTGARWKEKRHYLFSFHDSIFECVADGFNVEVVERSYVEVLQNICRTLTR